MVHIRGVAEWVATLVLTNGVVVCCGLILHTLLAGKGMDSGRLRLLGLPPTSVARGVRYPQTIRSSFPVTEDTSRHGVVQQFGHGDWIINRVGFSAGPSPWTFQDSAAAALNCGYTKGALLLSKIFLLLTCPCQSH